MTGHGERRIGGRLLELSSKGLQGEFERARPLVMIREVCNYLAGIERRRKALVYVGQGPAGKLFRPDASRASIPNSTPFAR